RLNASVASFPEHGSSAEELLGVCWALVGRGAPSRRVQTAKEQPTRTVAALDDDAGDEEQRPVAQSHAMKDLLVTATRVARGAVPVLVYGETGSGKEVIARFIHASGPRKKKPNVCVNCAAIPAQLVESTLFGHEKGSFTGAGAQQKGV